MGLDTVYLVYDIERKFGIAIPDAEAAEIGTVEDLMNTVFKFLPIEPNTKCLSQIIFYRLRQALSKFRLNRNAIKPDSIISALLPKNNLKQIWKKLEELLQLKLPELSTQDLKKGGQKENYFLTMLAKFETEPILNKSVGQLIENIIFLNINELIYQHQISNKKEFQKIIKEIISDNVGIPVIEIELKHSFTSDLGMD